IITSALLLGACGQERATPPSSEPARAEAPAPEPPPPVDEACAQVIVVAWQGATAAPPTVTRSETEARAKAEELRRRLDEGEDFTVLALTQSDAASSGPRGGLIGTYARDEWPAAHA